MILQENDEHYLKCWNSLIAETVIGDYTIKPVTSIVDLRSLYIDIPSCYEIDEQKCLNLEYCLFTINDEFFKRVAILALEKHESVWFVDIFETIWGDDRYIDEITDVTEIMYKDDYRRLNKEVEHVVYEIERIINNHNKESIMNVSETLNKMAKMALQRNEIKPYWSDKGGVKRYIRLNSDGFRLVSLDGNNPCGSLYRKINGKKEEVTSTDLNELISEIHNSDYEKHSPNKDKREHKLQATIIYTSLTDKSGKYLPKYLGCEKEFEKLIFVDDEFTIKDIRADLIFLGYTKDKGYFPVFVELKVERNAERLKEQLDNIVDYLSPEEIKNEFIMYVKNVTGVTEDISFESSKKVAIWPEGGDRKRTDHKLKKDDSILILGFRERYVFVTE